MAAIHINEQDEILLTFVDVDNKPSQAPSSVIPTWSVDDTSKATITPAADGRSAILVPLDSAIPAGSASVDVVVTATGTLPDGTVLIPGTLTFTLTASVPVRIVLTAQPPVPKV